MQIENLKKDALSFFAALLLLASSVAANEVSIEISDEDKRGADQTYLTYPEWFLVHSPAEYADLAKSGELSKFPFFAHIKQFWQSYQTVYNKTKNNYPFNGEYHVMVSVIGVSTTLEYSLKGLYEKSIGNLTEMSRGTELTQEDQIAAIEAKRYTDFLLEQPWYKFDFSTSLKRLWFETDFFGSNMLRKLERKYFLTTEYSIKAAYAWLLGLGTSASFDAPKLTTATIIKNQTGQTDLKMLPRYRPFTQAALDIAHAGGEFVEIAGNKGKIVISLWAKKDWRAEEISGLILMKQGIFTKPNKVRYVIEIEISKLAEALRVIKKQNLHLEHIYDF